MDYKVGTRGSKLALTQTEAVLDVLRSAYPQDSFTAVIIRTAGDRNQHSPIAEVGKGVFVDEIEDALLDGRIHMAVHSMKDMPAAAREGLTFCKSWRREDARDVLILREAASLAALPQGAKIGTGSLRRGYQLKKLRPDLQILPIRGNIDTRIGKLRTVQPDGTQLDGIVLAAAGLNRLGLKPERMQYLSVEEMIPAPAQGILAIELPEADTELMEKLNALSDPETVQAALVERAFLRFIGGDCRKPIGAYCCQTADGVQLRAMFGNTDGQAAYVCLNAPQADEKLAQTAAEQLLKAMEELENG